MNAIKDAAVDVLPNPLPVVDGKSVTPVGGGVHHHVYSATGQPTIDVPLGDEDLLNQAVAAAKRAARGWRDTPPDVRRSLLWRLARAVEDHADELAAIQVAENGTPLTLAQVFPSLVVDALEYYSGWPDKLVGQVNPVWPVKGLDYSVLEPYGVVAVIIPWNSPLYSLGSVAAPALTAGNTLVVKPPELTPFTSVRFAELVAEVGFPPGVINVVPGGAGIGSALVSHPDVDMIHFTGSGATARRIMATAAESLTPVALELGGKSPNLVFADADLKASAAAALSYCMGMSGQGCLNGTRLVVDGSVYDDMLDLVKEQAEALVTGDPQDADTAIGPVINQGALDRIMGMIERARDKSGGRIVTGGQRLDGEFRGGFYVAPTVVADVDMRSEIASEEVFGPVLSVLRFDTEDEALRIANDSAYGLGSYIQTNDLRRAHRFADQIDSGMVWINGFGGLPPSIPFGGDKQSGIGRIGGRYGIEEFSRVKNVWIAL